MSWKEGSVSNQNPGNKGRFISSSFQHKVSYCITLYTNPDTNDKMFIQMNTFNVETVINVVGHVVHSQFQE